MIAFAEHQFSLDRRDENGVTEREHLQALSERRGQTHPDLIGPPLPPAGAYLWRYFIELDAARGGTGFGPSPIGYQDILAWARLTGRRPLPWEVGVLMALDRACLAALAKGKG